MSWSQLSNAGCPFYGRAATLSSHCSVQCPFDAEEGQLSVFTVQCMTSMVVVAHLIFWHSLTAHGFLISNFHHVLNVVCMPVVQVCGEPHTCTTG